MTAFGWGPTSSSRSAPSIGPRLTDILDALDLAHGRRLAIVTETTRCPRHRKWAMATGVATRAHG